MKPIKVAMIGVGNCASSLVQGVEYYRQNNSAQGLIHDKIGGYGAGDVDFVLGIDVDARKVGKDIAEAIFAAPNNTKVFQQDVPATGAKVIMGLVSDGVADHTRTASGARGEVLGELGDIAERGRHDHELRLGKLDQSDLPGPATVAVRDEMELVDDHLRDVGAATLA